MKERFPYKKCLAWLFWISLWQIAHWLIRNTVIFVGPADMLKALFFQVQEKAFWLTIFHSFLRITLGFLSAFLCGILLGSAAYVLPLKISSCGFFCYPCPYLDRVRGPVCIYLLPGGCAYDLCKHPYRA